MRCYDEDIKDLKTITDELQKNNSKEYGGKLKVIDDLIEVKSPVEIPYKAKSEYYVPGEEPKTENQGTSEEPEFIKPR